MSLSSEGSSGVGSSSFPREDDSEIPRVLPEDMAQLLASQSKKTAMRIALVKQLLPHRPPKVDVDETDLNAEVSEELIRDMMLRKVHDDLAYVEEVFSHLSQELRDDNSFTNFYETVDFERIEQRKKADFIALYQTQLWKTKYYEKSNRIQDLARELRMVKADTARNIHEKDKEISNMMATTRDAKRLNPRWVDYEKKVAQVKLENTNFKIEQEQHEICDQTAVIGREIPQESHVHDALIAFLKESTARQENTIQDWKDKYGVDTKAKTKEVKEWEVIVKAKQEEIATVQERYDARWAVVLEYEQEKEQERLLLAEEERKHQAAAKIQAWWRGWLVRRGMNSGFKRKLKKSKSLKK